MKDLDTYKHFIYEFIDHIKEDYKGVLEDLKSFENDKTNPEKSFYDGQEVAYRESLELIENNAKIFNLDLRSIGLEESYWS